MTPAALPAAAERLRGQLLMHRAGDPREALSKEIMLVELDRLDDPFDRNADPTHVTASAIVVGDRGIVLHRHRRLLRWMQPGGHLDPGRPRPRRSSGNASRRRDWR